MNVYTQDKPNESLISSGIRGSYNYNLSYSGKIYKFNQVSAHEHNLMLENLYQSGFDAYGNFEYKKALTMLTEFINTEIYAIGIYSYELKLKKHDACEIVARIHLMKKNYNKALKYINYFKTKYPDYSTCGTGAAGGNLTFELLKADCLIGLNKTDEAINLLDHYMFNPSDFTDNKPAIKKLVVLYTQKYGNEFLMNALKESEIFLNEKNRPRVKFLQKEFSLQLFDEVMYGSIEDYKKGKIDKEQLLEILKTAFKSHYTYKLIMEN